MRRSEGDTRDQSSDRDRRGSSAEKGRESSRHGDRDREKDRDKDQDKDRDKGKDWVALLPLIMIDVWWLKEVEIYKELRSSAKIGRERELDHWTQRN